MKRSLKPYALLFFLVLCSIAGCYYDNVEELYPDGSPCDVSNITYSLDIKPIIDTNCAISGCHVAGTGRVNLTTYAGLKQVVDDGRLVTMVIQQKNMPPTQPLSKCQMDKIQAWIGQGALEN
jgi:hypothetical protein